MLPSLTMWTSVEAFQGSVMVVEKNEGGVLREDE